MYNNIVNSINNVLSPSKSVTIIDDIDLDGMGSAHIIFDILKSSGYDVRVKPNNQHGLKDNPIVDEIYTDILIVVDSSTNDVPYVVNKPYDVIILDHHIRTDMTERYISTNKILNINAKDYLSTQNFSTCMFVYNIFSQMFPDKITRNHLMLSYLTYFSDMIDCDDYVLEFIKTASSFLNIPLKEIKKTSTLLNSFRKCSTAPILISLMYTNSIDFSNDSFLQRVEEHRKTFSTLTRFILGKVKEFEIIDNRIKFIDLTKFLWFTREKELFNIKGTLASMLSEDTYPITITGILVDNKYIVSIRSKIPILDVFNEVQEEFGGEFNGHQYAFGGSIPIENIMLFLNKIGEIITNRNLKTIDALTNIEIMNDIPITKLSYLNLMDNKDKLYVKVMTGKEIIDSGYKTKININSINLNSTYIVNPQIINKEDY